MIPVADTAACAAGYLQALRQVLIRERIVNENTQCLFSAGLYATAGHQSECDNASVTARRSIPSRHSDTFNGDPEDGCRFGRSSTAASNPTNDAGIGWGLDDPRDVSEDHNTFDPGINDAGYEWVDGGQSCPATIPSFNPRATYTLRCGPVENVRWAWYRAHSKASAPSYSPRNHGKKRIDPVYKFHIERVSRTKCQFLIRTAAQSPSAAYFLGVESETADGKKAKANATWTLGAQSATPVYIIPWGRRFRIAAGWQYGEDRYAMLGVSGQPKGNLGWDVEDMGASWIIELVG